VVWEKIVRLQNVIRVESVVLLDKLILLHTRELVRCKRNSLSEFRRGKSHAPDRCKCSAT
jgi:hypothetical protein